MAATFKNYIETTDYSNSISNADRAVRTIQTLVLCYSSDTSYIENELELCTIIEDIIVKIYKPNFDKAYRCITGQAEKEA